MNALMMGHYEGKAKRPFTLPRDAQVQTFGVIGVRGSGKTVTATVMAEEFCKQALLWTAFDPISVWWGLRAKKDGLPGGYPVLVFGGKHGDIPIGKQDGKRIAEVIANENVFTVIDVKYESKTFWHTFVTDLALGLMEQEPETPRHIFIEEAPEFVPQKPNSMLSKRTFEAVERLVRLGRNQGYGCTLIGQRSATINKDVLSQCENLIAMRSSGSHDFKAFAAWLEAAGLSKDQIKEQLRDLAKMPSGTGNYWSPHFTEEFSRVQIRERETYHPGGTRKVGEAAKSVELASVGEIVARVQRRLSKMMATVPAPAAPEEKPKRSLSKGTQQADHNPVNAREEKAVMHPETAEELNRLRSDVDALRSENARLKGQVKEVTAKLEAVRKVFEPQHKAMVNLFAEIGASAGGSVDVAKYDGWLKKAGVRGCRKILEVMLEKQSLTAIQLATLSDISYRTLKNYRGWLKNNGLVSVDGDGEGATFTLLPLP